MACSDGALRGYAVAMRLYDVCEEIRLAELSKAFQTTTLELPLKHTAPEYLGVQRPPLVEYIDEVPFAEGVAVGCQIKYYDYGVISVVFGLPFEGTWSDLVQISSQWLAATDMERIASELVNARIAKAGSALVKVYPQWLSEDYFIFHLAEIPEKPSAADLLANCGMQITQVVRGENRPISPGEQNEVLQASISYYPDDVAVIGWNAAFIYDTSEGAIAAMQLLEYANTQLLEFRHYDEFLSRELRAVYQSLERGSGLLARWRLVKAASRLQATTLEVTELAERVDNVFKFLSDMFSARLYRLIAAKVGVTDYRMVVDQKLNTARQLYGFMVEQFQNARAFALEVVVVLILLIEIVAMFGKNL